MRKLTFIFSILICHCCYAQNVVGYWYGTANVSNAGSTNNYLIELIMKQSSTSSVQGIINYYFKNTFRSFKVTGSYNSQTRYLSIYNIPLTYFGSALNMEVDCPMNLTAQHRIAKAG